MFNLSVRTRRALDWQGKIYLNGFAGNTPIGVLEMAHPDADLAVAKAAAHIQIPAIFSNQASVSMEDCSAVMGNTLRWFQLYWSRSRESVASFVNRAEACGYRANSSKKPLH
ncbi:MULTISPECIES: alpha-hydroxy-acid oxidizing protein [unclassified Spirosoma]|uniref:alpha-hydroxy-acid oxidizing protein n=1 Tax=unclassified Spirosoma TaxID=2621999 RepID=UPI0009622912|nr:MULTISPECIES: alpha-hydroxy-acid oxidizing protein [unclassified Spirosoma]OJW74606.1 MAG: hypothetical protein BGO59_20440 [Spirosoma sp. 48-14]